MITVPTTLVIGAGASAPWGLPTADEMIKAARALNPSSPLMATLMEAFIVAPSEMWGFLKDLHEDPTSSLDIFLETRPDTRIRQIGKAMIAGLLAQDIQENASKRPQRHQNWIADMVEVMRAGARTIEQFADGNHVRFVTFNFDSILERELERAIGSIYRPSEDVLRSALQRFPICHVHGQLPRTVKPLEVGWLQQAENRVRVVHDDIDQERLAEARAFVGYADVLCFLGFSYHQENLKRIDIQTISNKPVEIYGSSYKLSNADVARVNRAFSYHINLCGPDNDSCGTLRAHRVLRDES